VAAVATSAATAVGAVVGAATLAAAVTNLQLLLLNYLLQQWL